MIVHLSAPIRLTSSMPLLALIAVTKLPSMTLLALVAVAITAFVPLVIAGNAVAESSKRTLTFGLSEPADARRGTMTVTWWADVRVTGLKAGTEASRRTDSSSFLWENTSCER